MLVSAAFPAFLIYGYNRYAYYVIPFLGGSSAILASLVFDVIRSYRTRAGDGGEDRKVRTARERVQ
ncbi:hypothetical protein JQ617_05050 [Bradyrhizobium sp. KB893862 SZCCT0404]|uniref:hypothetical protein n=1 Tax=Bradyrhizobium sp. KB893862 SZCCT0404 TaxID=2807672 RepID=UPI001BADEF9A|nr:hypothetical protein [Bradyrhizobium sp. KB893862 SZCCT0404]MBR1173313.1 hypothetical protein [Bradyrhizobium sp. KB893862 SZCCT0404]